LAPIRIPLEPFWILVRFYAPIGDISCDKERLKIRTRAETASYNLRQILGTAKTRYSQTPLYRNAPYRIPYVFGIASLNLENFAGYIGKPCYKLLRDNFMIFFSVSDIIRLSNLAVNTINSCDSRIPIMPPNT
jgi:hypothetical protein